MSHPLPAAVLWDMDGTLVDTEPHWMAAEGPLVESFGGTWSHEKALQLVGLALEDSARVLQSAGVRMSAPAIVELLTDRVLASLAESGVPFRPGARELLRALREAGVKTALVTMSYRRMADRIIDLIDFDAFDVVVTGDDANRPKPFPDPYLKAAELLGVDIRDTVAIEDSPNGIRSAVAAGGAVLGIPLMVSLVGTGAHRILPTLDGVTPDALADLLVEHRARAAARTGAIKTGGTA